VVDQLHGRFDGEYYEEYFVDEFEFCNDVGIVLYGGEGGDSHHASVNQYQKEDEVLYSVVVDYLPGELP